jgi:hypothetical protein
MQINKIAILLVAAGAFGWTSCNKVDLNKGITNNEKTIVKLPQAANEINIFSLDAKPGDVTIPVLEVRRDVISEADLNTTQVVKIAPNPQAIDDYNTNNGANLSTFTTYTLDPSTPFDGTNWVVTFGPGEFVKYINITFDPSKLDFSKRNGLAFKVADGGGSPISTDLNAALIEVAAKNKFDGVYTLRIRTVGWAAYGIADDLTGTFPGDYQLISSGATTVKTFSTFTSGSLQPAFTAGLAGATQFGATSPQFTFDAATNKLTAVSNLIPNDGRNRQLRINPAITDSRWDPATKKIFAAYIMSQNGRPDQFIYDTLTYKGAR